MLQDSHCFLKGRDRWIEKIGSKLDLGLCPVAKAGGGELCVSKGYGLAGFSPPGLSLHLVVIAIYTFSCHMFLALPTFRSLHCFGFTLTVA